MRFETLQISKEKLKQHPKNIFYNLLLLLPLLLIILPVHAAAAGRTAATVRESGTLPEIEYLEDKSGNLTIKQITSGNLSGSFQPYPGLTVSEGINRSSWWFRLRPGDGGIKDNARHISINNAYVEKAILYLPDAKADGGGYKVLNSGWHFKSQTQDEGFLYPVFKIPESMDVNDYCFLQVQSAYTHNYQIQILDSKQFDHIRLQNLLFVGGMLGILLAMILYNLIIYLILRDKTYLYYVIYVLSMFFYQTALLGLIRLLNHQLSEVLIAHVSVLGFITIISLLVFVRSFLETAQNIPGCDRFLKVSKYAAVLGIVLMIGGWKLEANVMSLYVTYLTAILILIAGIASLRHGVRQARWFLIAWSVMIIGGIVFSLRGWGWLPQNNLTIHMLLISAVVESILLSVALADRIRLLQIEKENALGLYKEAEASSKAHEIAFLQAQIKPHFLNNVLNVIAALCRLDAEKARELILDLSSYLQHTFAFKNLSQYIPFEDELEFIQAYVRIEKARFRDKLRVEYEFEGTDGLRLPPLILQPLVENAIRHGLRKSAQGGLIVLRVRKEKERFIIQIEDDGAGMTGEQLDKIMAGEWESESGVGIANINRRLTEMYGTGLDIKSIPGEGTTVTMVIPREKGESNESRTYR